MPDAASPRRDSDVGPIGQATEMLGLIREYAKQETLGPIKGAGKWLAWGSAGAVLIGSGSLFIVLALLRMFQTELAPTFRGHWMSVIPYAAALLFAFVLIAFALSRVKKSTLQKEKR